MGPKIHFHAADPKHLASSLGQTPQTAAPQMAAQSQPQAQPLVWASIPLRGAALPAIIQAQPSDGPIPAAYSQDAKHPTITIRDHARSRNANPPVPTASNAGSEIASNRNNRNLGAVSVGIRAVEASVEGINGIDHPDMAVVAREIDSARAHLQEARDAYTRFNRAAGGAASVVLGERLMTPSEVDARFSALEASIAHANAQAAIRAGRP